MMVMIYQKAQYIVMLLYLLNYLDIYILVLGGTFHIIGKAIHLSNYEICKVDRFYIREDTLFDILEKGEYVLVLTNGSSL